jgi:hypothetical protein
MWRDHEISKSRTLWFNVHEDEGSRLEIKSRDLKHWHRRKTLPLALSSPSLSPSLSLSTGFVVHVGPWPASGSISRRLSPQLFFCSLWHPFSSGRSQTIQNPQGNIIADQRKGLKIWENYITMFYDRVNWLEKLEVETEEEWMQTRKGIIFLQWSGKRYQGDEK